MASASSNRRRLWWAGVLLLVLVIGVAAYLKRRFVGGNVLQPGIRQDEPAALARWPWPNAARSTPHRGVRHWLDKTSTDGTTVELFEFDFTANPDLRFGLFDQDEDDDRPWDNKTKYWMRGVGQFIKQQNNSDMGKIIVATNGLFFGYINKQFNAEGLAHHVSPVVSAGKVHDFGSNHRWTFGVKQQKGKPVFKVFHLPARSTLERELDYGGGSAQCLVLDGKPLKLQPFPPVGAPKIKQPVPSTPQEAGHIPVFDHMRTCRVSLGWTKDSSKLYLLFVKEPDSETGSAVAVRRGLPIAGGWTVPDVQRFWLAIAGDKKVWTAINSDAGDLAQMAYIQPNGNYVLVSPRWANVGFERRTFNADFKGAPNGGAMMYFYVHDTGAAG